MGMTGYLLLRKALDGGSAEDNETILYETKAFVPFAWSALFRQQNLTKVGDDLVLAAKVSEATALARQRLSTLAPLVTPRLHRVLEQFTSSIESAGDGWLVLDPYRIDCDAEQLTAPASWFDAPAAEEVDAVFGNDDGVELDEDERIDVGDVNRVAGWTVTGDEPPWFAELDEASDPGDNEVDDDEEDENGDDED
jgi:hypothetical protein